MNISIEKKILSEAVHIAARFADKRSATLPALGALLLIAGDDGIKLRATNLETGVDLRLVGKIKEEGAVAVPAPLLLQITSSLTGDGVVTLERSGDILTIISSTGRSSLKTIPFDDFPSIPFPENPKNRMVISGAVIKSLFSTIASCSSVSTVRPELASIYLSISGGALTTVATDSFRLAEKKVSLANKGVQGAILIPAKNATEIAQALPDEDVIMSFDDNQCAFVSDGGMFVSRLTNAVYPDYQQIIPKESVVEAVVLRRDFETALKRTTIFSDSFQKIKLQFDPKKNTLVLSAKNAEVGDSSETIGAHVDGAALEIAFNHRYLSAVLSLTSAESLTLLAAGVGRPLVIKGVGDNTLLYLVSPMNQ